jgi:hypothetical protein
MGNQDAGYVRGLRACVSMLESMTDLDDHAVESHCRGLRPQDNAVLKVIEQILNRKDAAELEGFCASLTEMVIVADDGGDFKRDFSAYATRRERLIRRRLTPLNEREPIKRRVGILCGWVAEDLQPN